MIAKRYELRTDLIATLFWVHSAISYVYSRYQHIEKAHPRFVDPLRLQIVAWPPSFQSLQTNASKVMHREGYKGFYHV